VNQEKQNLQTRIKADKRKIKEGFQNQKDPSFIFV